MTDAALELRYLFGVRFADGSEFFQTAEDQSAIDAARSAYYDVCQARENGSRVEVFQLEGQGHTYLVDLRDGHFEIDGAPFLVELPPAGAALDLVYFRRRRHHANATVVVDENSKPRIVDLMDAGRECEYHFGWRAGERQVVLILA